MKKSTIRLLVLALLVFVFVGLLASCDFGGKTFTVKMYDGETVVKELTFDKGAAFAYTAADIAKTGYDVEGIYTDAAMTEKISDGAVVEADMNLYVKYRAKTLFLLVDDENGTEATRINVAYGQTYSLTAPEREGYRFLRYVYMGETFPLSGTFTYTAGIPITAKWEKIVYLNVFNGTTSQKVEVAADGSFSLPDVADTATHTFAGYLNGTETFGTYDSESGKWIGTYTGKADLTLTYKWVEIPTYTMTVNGLYGSDFVAPRSYKTGDTYSLPAAPTREGYTFLGYKMNGAAFAAAGTFTWTDDVVVTAEWQKIPTVTVMNGATVITSFRLPAGGSFTLPAVSDTLENAFLGYTGAAGFSAVWNATENRYDCTYTGTADLTVSYNWEGIRHIVFVSNGPAVAPILIVDGQATYTLSAADTATHYFIGFKKGEELLAGSYTLTAAELAGEDDVTLTAVWQEKHFVTIFDNGEQVGTPVLVGKDGSVTLSAIASQDAGKLFDGFKATGVTFVKTGDSYTATGITADLLVAPVWYVLPVVTLDPAEGVLPGSEGTVILSVGVNTLPIPQRDGFVFTGWKLGSTAFTGADASYTFVKNGVASGTTYHLVATWRSTDTVGEVVGKNYFKELDETGEIIYIFLTGTDNAYIFDGYTLALSENADVAVLNQAANGFVAKNPGTFTMTMTAENGSTRTVKCRVETRVNSFEDGTDTTSRNEENFVAENGVKIEGFLDAGYRNFLPDILVSGNRGGVATSLSYYDIPHTLTIYYKDNGSWTEYITEDGYTVKDGAITFTDEILIAKQDVKLVFTPDYALAADKSAQTVELVLKLNDGTNVYNNEELYAAYNSLTVKEINILRNIKAELNRAHVADDAKDASGQYIHPINAWDHGVYTRTLGLGVTDACTVNGNYYMIDGSDLPIIHSDNPGGSYSGLSSESDEKDESGLSYRTVNVQLGIFLYYSPSASETPASIEQSLTINDLYITSNNTEEAGKVYGDENGDGANDSTTVLVGQNVLRSSMSFSGIVVRSANLTTNKVTVKNANQGYFFTGENNMNPTHLHTTVLVKRTIVENCSNTGFYSWGQVGLNVTDNSYIGDCGGAAFHFDDKPLDPSCDAYSGYFYLDPSTVVENYSLGTEPWFLAYGMSLAATDLKQLVPAAIGGINSAYAIANPVAGASNPLNAIAPQNLISSTDKGEAFNFIACVVKSGGENSEWNTDTYKEPYIPIRNTPEGDPIALIDSVSAISSLLTDYGQVLDGITLNLEGQQVSASTAMGSIQSQIAAAPGGTFLYNCFDGKLITKASAGVLGTATVVAGLFN